MCCFSRCFQVGSKDSKQQRPSTIFRVCGTRKPCHHLGLGCAAFITPQKLLGFPMEDPDPPLDTSEGFWGLKTWRFEGPKSIGSVWAANLRPAPHVWRGDGVGLQLPEDGLPEHQPDHRAGLSGGGIRTRLPRLQPKRGTFFF